MISKKNLPFFIIVLLTLIAFIIRVYKLTTHPAMDIDEYSIGYNAYSIATTGRDEWGNFLPIFFKSFGDYKLAFDIYASSLFFKLFSVDIFWQRFPQVLAGTLYIPLIFLLLRLYIQDKRLVWLGTVVAVFAPYNIYFSRVSSGSITQSFFIIASITCFAYYIEKEKLKFLLGSICLLTLSLYTYPSAWIVAPVLIFGYMYIVIRKKKFAYLAFFLIFFIALLPILKQFYFGGSSVRLSNTSFLSPQKGAIIEIKDFRSHSNNDLLVRALHNKLSYFIYIASTNYVRHFDIPFLLSIRDDYVIQQSIYPHLFAIFFPFYFIGIIYLFKNYKNPLIFLLLLWVIVSPIPSTITDGEVSSKRYLSFLGSEIIVSMLGIYATKLYKNKAVFTVICSLVVLQIIHFLYFYYVTFPPFVRSYTHYKGNILADVVKKNNSTTDLFIYTATDLGGPQIYPLFATLYPPEKYVKEKKYTFRNWYYIEPFDRFYFSEDETQILSKIQENYSKKTIAILSDKELKTIGKGLCYTIKDTYNQEKPELSGDQAHTYYVVHFHQCK